MQPVGTSPKNARSPINLSRRSVVFCVVKVPGKGSLCLHVYEAVPPLRGQWYLHTTRCSPRSLNLTSTRIARAPISTQKRKENCRQQGRDRRGRAELVQTRSTTAEVADLHHVNDLRSLDKVVKRGATRRHQLGTCSPSANSLRTRSQQSVDERVRRRTW